jgi:hypothetical protein
MRWQSLERSFKLFINKERKNMKLNYLLSTILVIGLSVTPLTFANEDSQKKS